MEASPYLGDVSERMSTYNQDSNNHTQRFELLARFDTPVEEEALKVQQRKEAERLAAERRQAKAEEETEEDLEDELDDTEELEDEDPPEPPEAP